MNIGLKINDLIAKNNITVVSLASIIGKSRQTAYNILKEPHCDTAILETISKKLDVPLSYFFQDEEENETPEVKMERLPEIKTEDMSANHFTNGELGGYFKELEQYKILWEMEQKRADALLKIVETQAYALKR